VDPGPSEVGTVLSASGEAAHHQAMPPSSASATARAPSKTPVRRWWARSVSYRVIGFNARQFLQRALDVILSVHCFGGAARRSDSNEPKGPTEQSDRLAPAAGWAAALADFPESSMICTSMRCRLALQDHPYDLECNSRHGHAATSCKTQFSVLSTTPHQPDSRAFCRLAGRQCTRKRGSIGSPVFSLRQLVSRLLFPKWPLFSPNAKNGRNPRRCSAFWPL